MALVCLPAARGRKYRPEFVRNIRWREAAGRGRLTRPLGGVVLPSSSPNNPRQNETKERRVSRPPRRSPRRRVGSQREERMSIRRFLQKSKLAAAVGAAV